jgi:hypothetical protein
MCALCFRVGLGLLQTRLLRYAFWGVKITASSNKTLLLIGRSVWDKHTLQGQNGTQAYNYKCLGFMNILEMWLSCIIRRSMV